MSFLTGQDPTPKFAGQVLPDWTKSRLTSLNILHSNYELSIRSVDTNLVSNVLNQDVFGISGIDEKKILKKDEKFIYIFFLILSSIFNSVESLASGRENVRCPDSPDFVNFLVFRTRCDVQQSPNVLNFLRQINMQIVAKFGSFLETMNLSQMIVNQT